MEAVVERRVIAEDSGRFGSRVESLSGPVRESMVRESDGQRRENSRDTSDGMDLDLSLPPRVAALLDERGYSLGGNSINPMDTRPECADTSGVNGLGELVIPDRGEGQRCRAQEIAELTSLLAQQ